MRVKLFTKTLVTLLLVATLIMTLIISPILANSDFVDGSGDHLSIQNTGKDVPSGPTKLGATTFGTTDPGYPKPETLTERNVEPNSTVGDESNLNSTNEWSEFVGDDKGSAQLVIGINDGISDAYTRLMDIITKHNCEVVNTVSMAGEIIAVVINVSLTEMSSFVEETRADGLSRYMEPRMKVQTQLVPNDPYWSLQWGPQKIEADWAWNTTIGDHSVLVAVIDTGVDWDHLDLAANYVALGYDWVNNDANPMDDEGHGTHCAGIIAAVINNSIGVAGLAQVRIMAEKGLDQYGEGYEDDLANAIIHAVDQGADILSNSWGGYGQMELIHDAVKYAYDSGVLVVAAAGNDATSAKEYPAAYDEVIAVTATDRYDNPASFTNFGEWVELAAPGVGIYSTYWDNTYTSMSGTSMSTPHVSGVAALIWSQFPNMSRDWVRLWLQSTADDLGVSGFDVYYGYGRINARRAVEQIPPEHDLLILGMESPPYVEPWSTAYINTTVFNFGTSNESDVTVQLLANGAIIDSALIDFLASGTSATVSCSWSPTIEGMYNVTSYVVPVPGENITANNVKSVLVLVQVPPDILIVNDDDGSSWVSGTSLLEFELALTAAGYDYWVWNESSMGNPPLDFLTKFQLVIWTCGDYWNGAVDPTDAVTLESYLAQGGNILLEGEDIGYDHRADDFMVNVAHAIYQVDDTGALGLTVTDPTHPVTFGLPTSFTWLTDPPYDDGVSPTNGGAEVIQYTGTTWTAVTVFEGASNGSVVYYAFPLYCLAQSHGETLAINSINWLLGVQYEHELAVALEAPDFLEPDNSSLLNATVYNRGLNNETDVELFLLINGTEVNHVTIPELVNDTSYTIDYLWTPNVEGIYNLTAYAPPVLGENITTNNFATKIVIVLFAKYVLWDDVHDGDGDSLTGNYLSLYQLLSSSGFVVDELTSGTINSGVLTPYDILVLIDPEYDFLSSEITDIHDWVEAGGALIVVPDAGYPPTLNTIMAPYGVQLTGLDTGSGVTTDIIMHPITQNVGSIYYDRAWELAIASPSEALAWTLEHYAFLSATTGGEMVVISDSNIMDNYRLGMADNTQLMLNLFNWIGVRYEHELVVVLDAPTFLEPSDSLLLNATVHNRGLNNETDVELFLLINGTVVNNVTIPELLTGSSYTLSYLWTPTAEAIYNVTAYAPPVPGESVTINNIAAKIVTVRPIVIENVLVYTDDYVVAPSLRYPIVALDNLGIIYTHYADDPTRFGTALTSQSWDLVIVSHNNYYALGNYWVELEAYVLNGGLLIITTFDVDGSDSEPTTLWNTLGVQWASDMSYPEPVYRWVPTHPIFTSPNIVGDLTYYEEGYYDNGDHVTATTGNPIAGFTTSPTAGYASIVVGNGGRTVLISFLLCEFRGDEDADGKLDAVELWENAISFVAVPYEHDITVSLEAPTRLAPGESTLLNATVINRGLNNETNVELFLLINGTAINSTTISELLTGESFTINYVWAPTVEAMYNVTAYAPPVPGENVTVNNLVSRIVRVLVRPQLSIIPATIIGPPPGLGESFTVDIYIENVINLTGWQVGLTWNASVLQCLSWTTLFGSGTFLGPATDWLGVAGTINNTLGEVYPPYGYAFIGAGAPPSGNGTLVRVNFTVSDYGFTWINLTEVTIMSNGETIVDVANGTFELPLCYQLTVNSSPITGITLTINGTPKTTPYAEWLLPGSYTLVMPETHTVGEERYYWSQWSDGVTARSRTVTINTNITLTAYFTGPYYQLTVTSSPITGITFTIDGILKTTPYPEWLLEGSYTLVMPETHDRYVWSHWLEDGDTNRVKTITLQGTTWTAVYKRPRPVGGKATPINIPTNKPETPTLWIWLTILLPLAATAVFVKLKKKKQRILHT